MDALDRLMAEQKQLWIVAAQLAEVAAQPYPPEREALTELRWNFARTLLRHLQGKDRLVYARLRLHRDSAVVAIAERYSAEAAAMYEQFEKHAARWTPQEVEVNWPIYRVGVLTLVRLLNDRVAREERELLPHLATAPGIEPTRSPGDHNWAGHAWHLRERLGVD